MENNNPAPDKSPLRKAMDRFTNSMNGKDRREMRRAVASVSGRKETIAEMMARVAAEVRKP